jgi:hypothetical protein
MECRSVHLAAAGTQGSSGGDAEPVSHTEAVIADGGAATVGLPHFHSGGLVARFRLEALLDPWHGRILRKFL